jgi:drug/metabolite transporter (DMT)-like permease
MSATTDPVVPATRTSSMSAEGTHRGALSPADWALLLGSGLIWGASFLLIAEGLEAFEPGIVTFTRILFGFLTLGLVRTSRTTIDRGDWPRIVGVGITWLAFPMTLFPIAQQHISSSLAGMLNGAIPVFVALIAFLALRRAPGRWQLAGIATGVVGLVLIGVPSLGDGSSSALGVGLIVVAVMSYGVAVNLCVPLTQRYGSLPVLWRAQAVALVLTAPLGLAGLGGSTWSTSSFVACVVLGVFGTAIAFVMMTTLAARVGPTRASGLTYIEAAAALGLGVAIRGDHVAALEVVGCAVVLAGAWFIGRAEH